MDDSCGEWVECMGVASGCSEQEVGVASGSGWNLWVWLLGVVVRRYIHFLILLIPTPLVSVLFCSSIPTFCSFFKMFFILYNICTYFNGEVGQDSQNMCSECDATYITINLSSNFLACTEVVYYYDKCHI